MTEDWKERILAAAAKDGRSDRAISIAAGLGENFLNQLRHQSRVSPSVDKVLQLASELKLSRSQLFIGDDISQEDEEFLELLRNSAPAERQALLLLLKGRLPAKE